MDVHQHERRWKARVALLMFAAGTVAGFPLAVLLGALGEPVHLPEMAVQSAVAAAGAIVIARRGERLPDWAFHVLLVLGSGIVTVSCVVDGPQMHGEFFYVWPALYVGYFFTRAQALAHVGVMGAVYGGALLFGPDAPTAVSLWLNAMVMLTVLVEVVGRLRRRIDLLMQRLTDMARTDELTGLANRRAFELRLVDELARARRTGRPLTLVLLDIDLFKLVNDELGHAAGDETLRHVAEALRKTARAVDLTARIGGEEFALLLPDSGTLGALARAERLRESVSAGTDVTISLGVATVPDHGLDAATLLREADRALYAAKAAGRDRVIAAPAPTTLIAATPAPR